MGYIAFKNTDAKSVYHFSNNNEKRELIKKYYISGTSFKIFNNENEMDAAFKWVNEDKKTNIENSVTTVDSNSGLGSEMVGSENFLKEAFKKMKQEKIPAAKIFTDYGKEYYALFLDIKTVSFWPKLNFSSADKSNPDIYNSIKVVSGFSSYEKFIRSLWSFAQLKNIDFFELSKIIIPQILEIDDAPKSAILFKSTQVEYNYNFVHFKNIYQGDIATIETSNSNSCYSPTKYIFKNAVPLRELSINPNHITEIIPSIPDIKFYNDEFMMEYIKYLE